MPNNFLGLPPRYSDYAKAKFAVLPIPYDSTTSFQTGTREGPAAIIRASQQVEFFDEELEAEFYKTGVATLDPLAPNMAGPKAMHDDIHAAARRVVRDGKFLLGLGGEHSITSGLVRAVMGKHKRLSVLQIDAHLDLRDEWEGSPWSHASVMRRVLDLGASVVSVGIRNVSLEEHRFLNVRDEAGLVRRSRGMAEAMGQSEPRAEASEPPPPLQRGDKGGSVSAHRRNKVRRGPSVEVVTARQCHMDDDWVDRVLNALGETVYVTIDIDGFDPAFAPGTGTPEPGGLDWYQVTGLLRLVAAEKCIVAADIVEVMPIPGQAVTEFLAARLAYKLMCYLQART
jgi:agmatinase